MTASTRRLLFLVAAPGLAAVLLVGMVGLGPVGREPGAYGQLILEATVPERHTTNAVTAVNFDYRGFDTLGEEFILFAAVAGVAMILRERRGESERARPEGERERVRRPRSEAVRWLGVGMIAVVNLFGLYIVFHGQLTPGGGFQGGAILGTGSLLAYLASSYRTYRRAVPKGAIDVAESVGAGGYALVGIASILMGGAFLENVLPLGTTGSLLSAGTIPVINLAVGLEVAAGFALLFAEFLEETRRDRPGDERTPEDES